MRGRTFAAADEGGAPVAVINKSLARQLFQTDDAVGREFAFGSQRQSHPPIHVIGIVEDARYSSMREDMRPTAYVFYRQQPEMKNAATFEVRSVVSPYTLVPSMREIVREIDPDMPMYSVMTQTDQIETSLRTERLFARLAALLGGVAVLLSAIGLYGLLAYGVARRTPEIGLRMALGAERALVRWMILRESLILAAVGLLLGIPAALVRRPRPAVDALRSCADGSRHDCGRRAVDARAGRACRLHTRETSLACRSDGGPSRGLGVACVTRLISRATYGVVR